MRCFGLLDRPPLCDGRRGKIRGSRVESVQWRWSWSGTKRFSDEFFSFQMASRLAGQHGDGFYYSFGFYSMGFICEKGGSAVVFLGGDLKEKEWPWFLYPIVVISSDFLSIPCIICFCLDESYFRFFFLPFWLITCSFFFCLFFRFLPRVSSWCFSFYLSVYLYWVGSGREGCVFEWFWRGEAYGFRVLVGDSGELSSVPSVFFCF